jgi:hypothetical protein
VEEMRAHKAEKFKELKGSRNTKEYEEWFLSYKPGEGKHVKNKVQKRTNRKNIRNTTNKKNVKNMTKKRGRGGLFEFKIR